MENTTKQQIPEKDFLGVQFKSLKWNIIFSRTVGIFIVYLQDKESGCFDSLLPID